MILRIDLRATIWSGVELLGKRRILYLGLEWTDKEQARGNG